MYFVKIALNALREQNIVNDEMTPDTNDAPSRVLHLTHFITPLESGEVVPSLSDRAELSRQLEEWNKMYGTGATGYKSVGWGFSTTTHSETS